MTNFHVLGFENNMQDSFGGLVSADLGHGSPNYDCGQVNWTFPLHAINNRKLFSICNGVANFPL